MKYEKKPDRNHEIVKMRYEGKSMTEIAEIFKLSPSSIADVCRRHGVGGVMSHKNGITKNPRNQYTNGTFDREANAIRYIKERTPNFEYAGNFTGLDGYVDLRCKECGGIARKSFVSVRHGTATCMACAKRKRAEAREAEHNRCREQKKAEKEQRENDRLLHTYGEQIAIRTCSQCGDIFIPTCTTQRYCSQECANRRQYSIRKDKRMRKMQAVIIDKDITIEKLYHRDNGTCYLCGRVCDWNDYTIRDDGTFIAHNNYPSIDHILPLSRGGKHSWDNVRLACRGCNSAKSDKLTLPIAHVG